MCSNLTTTLMLALIVLLNFAYHDAALDFTFSNQGIQKFQRDNIKMKTFFKEFTSLGGGAEAVTLCCAGFLLGSRETFFYYLSIYTIDKMYISFGKLLYHEPRPYMISLNILPMTCSRHFGNPSGHSSCASMVAFALFLDIFHGKPHDKKDLKVYSWVAWVLGLLAAITWSALMPVSRYFLGAHSLDQIVYGTTLGLWGALTSHFLVRDNLMTLISAIKIMHEVERLKKEVDSDKRE